MSVSVLTLNKNRSQHLRNLIYGLERNKTLPTELIIAQMDQNYEPYQSRLFPIHHIAAAADQLSLAQARNKAAKKAYCDKLIFLDVDCIAAGNFVDSLSKILDKYNAIISPKIYYLPDDMLSPTLSPSWQERDLKKIGKPHEVRNFPSTGLCEETNPGLFWSIAFAISKENFYTIGQFSEDYIGYGAEDTDFGFRAAQKNIKHFLTAQTAAFHQYHQTFEPPWQHFDDIIKNAQVFYGKWKFWPMSGWLQAFADENLIIWHKDRIELLKKPSSP